jgi:hypothetical protein
VFIKALGWWLFPTPGPSKTRTEVAGTALICGLYVLEVVALLHLL